MDVYSVVNLNGYPDPFPHPQIGALSPNPISADIVSVVLSVEGTGFVPQYKSSGTQIHCRPRSSTHVTCKRADI